MLAVEGRRAGLDRAGTTERGAKQHRKHCGKIGGARGTAGLLDAIRRLFYAFVAVATKWKP